MKYLGIYCAGRLGKELFDIAIRINNIEHRWDRIVFIDDVYEDDEFYGARVFHPTDIPCDKDNIEIIIANGTPVERRDIRHKVISLGLSLGNLIDPTAIISPTATIGKGVIITPYSTISSDVILDDNVLIHSYVRVGHDIEVGKDSVLSSNVGIGGKTVVGSQTYIGMGAVIKDELRIGSNSIISMGAIVHTDVENGVTLVGLPARVAKLNVDGKVFK
jgi:sugar O-acyltransferase (sialic acid O-acetyltransferase NeuD family)